MTELPEYWASADLSELAELIMGQSPPSSTYNQSNDGLPFFQGKAEFGKLFPIPVKSCSQPIKIAKPGDILISVRAPVGPTNLCVEDSCIGRGLAAIRPINCIPSLFILFYLRSIETLIANEGTGSTFTQISKADLAKLKVPVPPLTEQHRIVAKLERLLNRVNAAQERLASIPDIIKHFRQSVLSAAFTGKLTADWRANQSDVQNASHMLDEIKIRRRELIEKGLIKKTKFDDLPYNGESAYDLPNTWKWCNLNEITRLITDGKHGDCEDQTDSGYFFLSAKDIKNGSLVYDDARQIKPEQFSEVHKRTNLEGGDICLVNTGATVGKLAIAPDCERTSRTTFQKSVAVIKLIRNDMSIQYVAYYLKSRSQALLNESAGSAVNNLLISTIKMLSIPLSPVAEQQEIVRRISTLFKTADALEERYLKAKAHVDKLTQSILARAFRGKLVSQDANDEPASVLLERIKSETNGSAVLKRRSRK